jgi:DnaK suppressor protein
MPARKRPQTDRKAAKPKGTAKTAVTMKKATKTVAKRAASKRGKGGKYADIRRDLERQREALLQEAGVALTNKTDFETFPDLSDQASAEMDQNFLLRLKDRERKLVKKIDEALNRIAAGEYGICERCGLEIPYPRLKARPVTTLCIECKTLQEQEELIRR